MPIAIEVCRRDYNTVRPHSALDDQTPEAFADLSTVAPPRPDHGNNPDGLTLPVQPV